MQSEVNIINSDDQVDCDHVVIVLVLVFVACTTTKICCDNY